FHTNQCNRKKAWSEAARIAKQELQSPTGSQYPLPGDFRDVKGKFGLAMQANSYISIIHTYAWVSISNISLS
ncbi:MAG: hypothetical protein K8F91_09705, partial [Candidatus Obscuribacterales bacterium]|nr:hypothetical protein [Candidatus Obscuribacterales bacterium]